MVGTKTSNRCDTCRQRKVKCDERWPVCGPCAKGRRSCPGPPKKDIRFVESDENMAELPVRSRYRPPSGAQIVTLVGRSSEEYKNLHMVTLRSKNLKNGVQMQKIRLVDLPKAEPQPSCSSRSITPLAPSPPLSSNESLSARLYATLDPTTNAKIHSHSLILRELIGRFGTSSALDNATLCLVTSHEAVVRGDDVSTWFNIQQYGKALRSIQEAIDNPNEQYTTSTLAAISVMWRTEAVFCRVRGVSNQGIHGRAMAHIFRHRGICNTSDPLELYLIVDCLMGDVQAAVTIPRPSIFDSDVWDRIFSSIRGQTLVGDIYWQLMRELVKWPGLVHSNIMLQVSPELTSVTTDEALRRAISVAGRLELISQTLSTLLTDPKICVTAPSGRNDPLVPIVHQYRDPNAAMIVAYASFYSITVNRIVAFLNSRLPVSPFTVPVSPTFYPSAPLGSTPEPLFSPFEPLSLPFPESFLEKLHLQNVQLSQRVWMMYEQVRQWKPIGCLFFLNALKASFPWAGSLEMRQWILDAANDIEDFLPEQARWNPVRIELWAKCLSGEAIDDQPQESITSDIGIDIDYTEVLDEV
ncbi:hypothetical protein BDV96DRAFT_684715 [Lophiotrema nucula]|uniref:Zn(2)-C6 fungal-type domain-containing protein n=1 Tax=Lophiotrema nucula TaxID=690887 RepID=A0A6A5ZI51_9PLEO|nr:hypothetical protein BDV96DRAFT_684715 [Lophiotrema nucula]